MEHCASAGTRQCTTSTAGGCFCGVRYGHIVAPFPQVVDTQGTEAFASHHSLPAESAVTLLPASLRTMSAPASPAASTAWRAPVLDVPLGSSSSSAVGEAPKLELSGSSGEMDLLGVCSSRDSVQYRVMSNVRSISDAAPSLYEEHRGVALVWA